MCLRKVGGIFISLTRVRQVWGIYVSLLFTSYRFEAGLKNIYVSVICLIRVWGGCEEYLYLFDLAHTGLWQVWGIFRSLLFALYGCEGGVRNIDIYISYTCEAGVRNMYISFIYLIQVWGGCEEYLYLVYLPRTGLRRVWGILISLLFVIYGCEAGVRNVCISLFTSYGFKVGLRNIYFSLICLIQVWRRWEQYLYLFDWPHTGLRRVWGIFISMLFPWYGCEAGVRNISFIYLIRV